MPRTMRPPADTAASVLLARLRGDYPQFLFATGSDDHWDARQTIYFTSETPPCLLLHELAHALLAHREYTFDIDLIHMERAAWKYARFDLAPRYGIGIDEDDVEDALDTYRAWLHNRSLCPDCHLSGLQQPDLSYVCVVCRGMWRANAAKTCALRRFRQPA